jgi:hypothetical protein
MGAFLKMEKVSFKEVGFRAYAFSPLKPCRLFRQAKVFNLNFCAFIARNESPGFTQGTACKAATVLQINNLPAKYGSCG